MKDFSLTDKLYKAPSYHRHTKGHKILWCRCGFSQMCRDLRQITLWINVFSTEILRRIHCLVMTFLQRGSCLGLTGSALLHHKVLTIQSLRGKQKSTRSWTGAQFVHGDAPCIAQLSSVLTVKLCHLQFPVSGPRWGQVIISRWRHRIRHLPQRCTQTGESAVGYCKACDTLDNK